MQDVAERLAAETERQFEAASASQEPPAIGVSGVVLSRAQLLAALRTAAE